jgi:pimeloyl-ACP methyl ester carboxylesterase
MSAVTDSRLVPVSEDPPIELYVRERPGPDKQTLLVVHGGPDWDASYLVEPLARLPDRHRVLWPDLRGCGRSTRGLAAEALTWDAAVGDLVALLDALGLGAVDVLGFSTGGLLAQRLALLVPDRVRRLIVASSSVEPVPEHAFAGWAERDRRRAGVFQVDAGLDGPERTRAWALASADSDVWRADSMPDYLRRLDRVRFSGDWAEPWLAGRLGSARPGDGRRRLAATGIPILLLQGRQDMTFPAGLADVTAAELPAAQAHVLDEAGHMAHVDQPERWLAAVEDFLA